MGLSYACMICGKPATMHYLETINGVTKEMHYCSDCVKIANINGGDIISSIFADKFQKTKNLERCVCGFTEEDIISSGKFGCSECYKKFKNLANRYINSLGVSGHKSNAYTQPQTPEKLSEIEQLYHDLKNAVDEERYIDADEISKQIGDLKNKLKGGV